MDYEYVRVQKNMEIWKSSNYKQFKKDKSRNLIILRSFNSTLKALGNRDSFFKPNDMVRNML